MKKALISLLLAIISIPLVSLQSHAKFDPLAKPNNFHGIHILFPSELHKASELVNSNAGEWGYVIIPIQVGDKDLIKWQEFMDQAKELKLIPIIRLSTEPDPQNTSVWRKPNFTDILDFANFLNSLDWPIENRYVVVFNEINRFDEWGGEAPNPRDYADILHYSLDVFHAVNPNFYMIMGGMDNASPNDRVKYMDNLVYIEEMIEYDPVLFTKLDGFSSHSYPNPGFSMPPSLTAIEGVATYKYEYELINKVSGKKVPAFITETGWDSTKLGDALVADYFEETYRDIWGKDAGKIVAITPFLLHSQGGPFDTFSFIKNGQETSYFQESKEAPKTKGEPLIEAVKGEAIKRIKELQTKTFSRTNEDERLLMEDIIFNYVRFFF